MNDDLRAIISQNRVVEFSEGYLVLMLPKSKVDLIREIPKNNWCVAFDRARILHFNFDPIITRDLKRRIIDEIPGTGHLPQFWRYFYNLKTIRQEVIAKGGADADGFFYLAVENPFDPNFFRKMRAVLVTEDENIPAFPNRTPIR